MTLTEYQELAARTTGQQESAIRLAVSGLGITGEAGEVADMLKKHIGHDHPLDRVKLAKELGDVLWYLADIATQNDLDLHGIAVLNIQKLRARYPDGFESSRSLNRNEEV